MSIFTNWIFWIVLSTILFIFALIGFLTDKKKGKNKTDDNPVSDNSSLNNSTEVLNSTNTNANSFNLESPVQEEVKSVPEPAIAAQEGVNTVALEVNDISEPVMTVQNDILDVSGSLSLGEANSLNGNQDNPSFTNGSLGENVQMSEGNPLGGDDLAIRNQVNLNPTTSSGSQGEVSLQSTAQPSGQVNNVNEMSSVSAMPNDVNNSVFNGQDGNVSVNGDVQNVNGMTNSGVAMTPENAVNSSPEIPVNNMVSDQPAIPSMPTSGAVNNSGTTDNTEKIYDTWS